MHFYLKYNVLNEPLNNPTPTFKEPILVGIILVKISFKEPILISFIYKACSVECNVLQLSHKITSSQ